MNDTLGHNAGDQVLLAAARRVLDLARPGDLVARHGGDEIVDWHGPGPDLRRDH